MLNLDQLESENEARRVIRDGYCRLDVSGQEALRYFKYDNACEVIEQLIAEVLRLTQGEAK